MSLIKHYNSKTELVLRHKKSNLVLFTLKMVHLLMPFEQNITGGLSSLHGLVLALASSSSLSRLTIKNYFTHLNAKIIVWELLCTVRIVQVLVRKIFYS